MSEQRKVRCPECGEETVTVSRREFMKQAGATAAVVSAGAVPLFATPRAAFADDAKPKGTPETAVKRLYESLKDEQKKVICKPFDDPLRQKYGANWAITKPSIAEFFTKNQQETIREIFRGCTSGEGYERFMKQMKEDAGGFGEYHVAIFGKPGDTDKFQFVMTGRHVTIRDDGNFDDGMAFGGPMVYGHGTGDSRLLTIHPRCLVTTLWLKVVNHLRELARGKAKHGSCGQGIGETRSYWLKYGEDAVFAADLREGNVLRHKLELQRQRTLLDCQQLIEGIDADFLHELDFWNLSTEDVVSELNAADLDGSIIDATIPECRTAIFEGAQGVLLDEYRGFHPYTTWSTVTPHHAWELVHQMGVEAVAVLGVTRAYATRHGEGPMPTYSAELTARLQDAGNPWNRWQGSLRCGWLDLPLLRYAAAAASPLDGIVVNHLDQIREGEWQLCQAYRTMNLSSAAAPNLAWQSRLTQQLGVAEPVLCPVESKAILDSLADMAQVIVTGTGPTHLDRGTTELPFRMRRSIEGSASQMN